MARRRPDKLKEKLVTEVRKLLPAGYDVETHFTPSYKPWDQRLCLVPDADLFKAIASGSASVVTDTIDGFTQKGIRLGSGEELEADIVVTATGLRIQLFGNTKFDIDGVPAELAGSLVYKGMMLAGMPNFSYTFGYTNASWTLKADLTAAYLCRMLRHMDRKGYVVATPRAEGNVETRPLLGFTSSYVQRALDILPVQGVTAPWRLHQNYVLDMAALKFGRIEDRVMEFAAP